MLLNFWLCFVPLFFAVDAIGTLPMFMSLTEFVDRKKTRMVIIQSIITAVIVALGFLAIGNRLLRLIGITVADFMVAGGILLFIISVNDMLAMEKKQSVVDADSLGAVPIGVPLIVGPAVLTTSILLLDQYGAVICVSATIINILIAGVVFLLSEPLYKVLGKAGSKTVSKLASLLLAAIAVMLVRKGIMIFMSNAS